MTAGEMWAGLAKLWGQGELTYSAKGRDSGPELLGGQLQRREGFCGVKNVGYVRE